MKTFDEIKTEFIQRAIKLGACKTEQTKLESAQTNQDLIELFKSNCSWILRNGLTKSDELIEIFGVDFLNQNNIYTSGSHSVSINGNDKISIVTLGSSQATVETWDNSQATVKTFHSSQATVETLGNSQATVKTWDSSQATVKTFGSSQATVETWDNSQATVKTWDNSQATVKTFHSSQATVDASKGGLIQDLSAKKLYIKKSDYEIILID